MFRGAEQYDCAVWGGGAGVDAGGGGILGEPVGGGEQAGNVFGQFDGTGAGGDLESGWEPEYSDESGGEGETTPTGVDGQ